MSESSGSPEPKPESDVSAAKPAERAEIRRRAQPESQAPEIVRSSKA